MGDLLATLLLARDEETGETMSDRQVRDEVMTILLAGHETSGVALAWTWYLLSQHLEVERRLHAELDAVLGGRTPSFDDLPQLRYTRMVIEETLRLYPPAWGIARQSIAQDEIGDYHIPKGVQLMVTQYVTHRHPDFWERPEVFEPERFRPECVAKRPKFAYYPFGGGPRGCIGNQFALMEMQLILATLAQRYQLSLVPGHRVEVQPLITLRPRYGIRMMLRERQ
jgi:cytochrome P450